MPDYGGLTDRQWAEKELGEGWVTSFARVRSRRGRLSTRRLCSAFHAEGNRYLLSKTWGGIVQKFRESAR